MSITGFFVYRPRRQTRPVVVSLRACLSGPGGTGDPLPLCSVAAQEQYGATPRRPGLPAARTTTLAGWLSEVTT